MNRGMREAVCVLLLASVAWATGPTRGVPLDATLSDSEGRPAQLARYRGKPVVLFYEDRDSTALNRALKEELFARGKALGLLAAAHVVAVADLRAFNFFPALPIALAFVRAEERKVGVPILVDTGGVLTRSPWGLPPRTSSVLLLDAGGRVVFQEAGTLSPARRAALFQTLGQLLGVDLAGADGGSAP